jgi:hypothetical protein
MEATKYGPMLSELEGRASGTVPGPTYKFHPSAIADHTEFDIPKHSTDTQSRSLLGDTDRTSIRAAATSVAVSINVVWRFSP